MREGVAEGAGGAVTGEADDGGEELPDPPDWNKAMTFTLTRAFGVGPEALVEDAEGAGDAGLTGTALLVLTALDDEASALIEPNDWTLRPSDIGGTFAGDDDKVAPASLIEPKLSAAVARRRRGKKGVRK